MTGGYRKQVCILLMLLAAAVFAAGCGGGGSETTGGTTQSQLPAKILSWEPPTSYIDSSTMNPVTDLDRYEVYLNETGTFNDSDIPKATIRAFDSSTQKVASSFNLANLSPNVTVGPRYYVSLRAVALTGLKSDFSTPISFSF